MKDKYKNLYNIMELLKDEFIEEALEDTQIKIHRFSLHKYIVPAACACILILCSGLLLFKYNYIFKNNRNIKTENSNNIKTGDGNKNSSTSGNNKKQNETLPGIKYEKNIADKDSLKKIICGFRTEGAGGGNYGWLVVKSYEDAASKNPTRNNTDGIIELPVFKNEDGIWSDTKDGFKESEIYFGNRLYEETRDYSYDGAGCNRWGICFRSDKKESLTEQLLEYTFYRVNYTIYTKDYTEAEEKWVWRDIMKPPSGTGKMYPLISLKEAEKKLRNGEFFSHNPYDKDVAGTAQILSVELEYMTQKYQFYLQPFYKFTITDKSWDKNLYKVMKAQGCKNYKEYTSVGYVYVPAVKDKYLDIRENAMLRTN